MELTVLLKDERKYTFYGLRKYVIEYGKYLKFTYTGEKDVYLSKRKEKQNEGCFMLDAIAGYYINRQEGD